MREFVKPFALIVAALLIPIVPFLILGDRFENRIAGQLEGPHGEGALSRPALFAMVTGVLATDVLLPIPSSTVSTLGGARLGVWLGTAASWLGMTLGALVGFAAARVLGRPLARRWTGDADLARMERLAERFGPSILVLFRAVPVLAEASVLLMGAAGLAWQRFLLPVAAANLGIALAWSALGHVARDHSWLPFALGVSVAVPLLVATMVRRWLPGHE